MSEKKITNIYEHRPLKEQIPEDWRDQIGEINERYKKLYTALVYDVMSEVYNLHDRSLKPGIGPLERGGVNGKVAGPAFPTRRCSTPNMDPVVHNLRLGLMASMCQGCVYVLLTVPPGTPTILLPWASPPSYAGAARLKA